MQMKEADAVRHGQDSAAKVGGLESDVRQLEKQVSVDQKKQTAERKRRPMASRPV